MGCGVWGKSAWPQAARFCTGGTPVPLVASRVVLGLEELDGDLVNGACSHDDDEVAWPADDFELFDDGFEGVEVHGFD